MIGTMSRIKKFFMDDDTIIINMTSNQCNTSVDILESQDFKKIITVFLSKIDNFSSRSLQRIKNVISSSDEIIEFFKLLIVFSFERIVLKSSKFTKYGDYRNELADLVKKVFDYWNNHERYGVLQTRLVELKNDNSELIDQMENFSKNILSSYHFILGKLLTKPNRINRQTSAGFNAVFNVAPEIHGFPAKYSLLKGVNIVSGVAVRTPFMGYTNTNLDSRPESFKKVDYNPLRNLRMTKRHWLCFPIKVGELLMFVYVHRTLMHQAVSLFNAFEPGINDYYEGKKPRIIYIYGGLKQEDDFTYCYDKENDIYVGYVARNKRNNCFKYMRNMILALHNLYVIKQNKLPIYGTMANVVTKEHKERNIAIIGDDELGIFRIFKTLKSLAKDRIIEINFIFNDMGIFYLNEGKIYAKGTGTGVYMLLEDSEPQRGYGELNQAVFLSPESKNTRILIENTSYEFVTKEHEIDYVFLISKEKIDSENHIRYIKNYSEILKGFNSKEHVTKSGLITNFFSNDLSSTHLMDSVSSLTEEVFNNLLKDEVIVAEFCINNNLGFNEEQTEITEVSKAIISLL